MLLVVYLGHWIFHPVSGFIFFLNQFFGRGLELPKLRNLGKKVGTLYRSTRLMPHICRMAGILVQIMSERHLLHWYGCGFVGGQKLIIFKCQCDLFFSFLLLAHACLLLPNTMFHASNWQ